MNRRTFLKSAAFVVTSFTIPDIALPAPSIESKPPGEICPVCGSFDIYLNGRSTFGRCHNCKVEFCFDRNEAHARKSFNTILVRHSQYSFDEAAIRTKEDLDMYYSMDCDPSVDTQLYRLAKANFCEFLQDARFVGEKLSKSGLQISIY